MGDAYQAIYDATRSRIHGGDMQQAMETALREAFGRADQFMQAVQIEYLSAAYEQQRPSVVFRPKVYIDGNQWCALYGDNLQDGVAGFGDSPDQAMREFDKAWGEKLKGASHE